ncbi:MAG TPA: hypothetical protein DCS93_03070 [Microscillaceae bacterium]|nr:hypothetical protein [Microscillaceae bacterium]
MNHNTEQQAEQLWGTYTTLEDPDEQEKFWQTYQAIVHENQTTFLLQRAFSPKSTPSSGSSIRLEAVYNPANWVYQLVRLSIAIGVISMLVSVIYDQAYLFFWWIFIGATLYYVSKRINTIESYSAYLRVNRKLASTQVVIPWTKIQYVQLKSRTNPLYTTQTLTINTIDKAYKVRLFLPVQDMEELVEKLAQKGFKIIR